LTLTLNKSIAAKRLNSKNGTSITEPETTIPYGSIIEYVGPEQGNEKFRYLQELFRCPRDILASALDGGKIPEIDLDAAPKPLHASGPAVPPAPVVTLKFERLASGSNAIARAKVPGGWLVTAGGSGITFYPDAEHGWNGESL